MSNDVDYHDVQRMIEEEASRLRGRIDNGLQELRRDLNRRIDEIEEHVDRRLSQEIEKLTADIGGLGESLRSAVSLLSAKG